jgi:hypothetical protein
MEALSAIRPKLHKARSPANGVGLPKFSTKQACTCMFDGEIFRYSKSLTSGGGSSCV